MRKVTKQGTVYKCNIKFCNRDGTYARAVPLRDMLCRKIEIVNSYNSHNSWGDWGDSALAAKYARCKLQHFKCHKTSAYVTRQPFLTPTRDLSVHNSTLQLLHFSIITWGVYTVTAELLQPLQVYENNQFSRWIFTVLSYMPHGAWRRKPISGVWGPAPGGVQGQSPWSGVSCEAPEAETFLLLERPTGAEIRPFSKFWGVS